MSSLTKSVEQQSLVLASAALFLATVTFWLRSRPRFPLVNGKKWLELTTTRSRKNFAVNAKDLIREGFRKSNGGPFRIIADVGEVLILPPRYAQELRDHSSLSFTQAAFKWFYAHLPGFEGFREGTNESQIMKLVARHQLTHQLTLVTPAVASECSEALREIYTDDKDWHMLSAKEANLKLMARISSRVFLGKELCRDNNWLRITTTYTVIAFRAVEELRFWPSWLRSTVQWFLPNCTQARHLVDEARSLIQPIVNRRKAEDRGAGSEKNRKSLYNDAIEWLEQNACKSHVQYDPACAQLSLSVAALHSSSDFFTQVIIDICSHPEIVEPLRDEIKAVVGNGAWTKHSLYDLKLMDSVMKESQRLKPIAIASMRRYTTAEVILSTGIRIPKGTLVLTSADRHWDPDSYDEPLKWDGYRFFNLRSKPGKENSSQLVSASPDHLGFGFGVHACPGRFFASEEIKIALCHMLMKYDFKLDPDSDAEPRRFGFNMTASPTARLLVRKREEEINIEAPTEYAG